MYPDMRFQHVRSKFFINSSENNNIDYKNSSMKLIRYSFMVIQPIVVYEILIYKLLFSGKHDILKKKFEWLMSDFY